MKIYLAGPISGLTKGDVFKYWDEAKDRFERMGYSVFSPITGKDNFRTESQKVDVFKAAGFNQGLEKPNPIITDHAIAHRDLWMVKSVDIIYANLFQAKTVSIGTVSEIAWGKAFGKNVIVVMEEGNIHQHAFIKENATSVFPTPEDAEAYLSLLIK